MKKTGLVLAGGGSLGAYEVGVLKLLNELNYKFDVVTGTSIGAINGAFVVMDRMELLEEIWLNVTSDKIIKDGVSLNYESFTSFSFKYYKDMIKTYAHIKGCNTEPYRKLCKDNINFDIITKSKIKFGIITALFPSFVEKKIIMNEISDEELFFKYLYASSACYPIFPLEKIDGKDYIDGGFKNNLPIDFCFELGADEIIAINLPIINLNRTSKKMIKLDNVKVICPKFKIASIMNFEQKQIRRLINLGYLDAKKSFGLIRGNKYYITKNDKEEEISQLLYEEFFKDKKRVLKTKTDNKTHFVYDVLEKLMFYSKLEVEQEYDIFMAFDIISALKDRLNKKMLYLYNTLEKCFYQNRKEEKYEYE